MTYVTGTEGSTGITAEMMLEQGDLGTIEQLRDQLVGDENITHVTLPVDGRTHFEMADDWHVLIDGKPDDETVKVWARIDERRAEPTEPWERPEHMAITEEARRLQLTKAAVLELTGAVGLTKTYVVKTPARLIAPQLDYWYASPDRQTKLFTVERHLPYTLQLCDSCGQARKHHPEGVVDHEFVERDTQTLQVATGATKATLQPFSNTTLLNRAVRAICERYGIDESAIYYDRKKTRHSMKLTNIYLVIPESTRSMRPGDEWSGGVHLKNSLLGESPTTARSFMFRWWCKNGCTTKKHESSTYSRRGAAGTGDGVYDWIGRAVEESLSQVEGEFDRVQAMTTEPIEGEVRVAIDNIVRSYKLPPAVAEAIRNQMMETSDVTMYGLMNAVTAAANSAGLKVETRERLMDIGGDMVYGAGRCESCGSVQVDPTTGATTPHQH